MRLEGDQYINTRTYPQMIEQSTRSSNNQVDTLCQLVRLGLPVGSSHQDSIGLRVVLHQVFGDTVDLQSEFSCRSKDDNSGT